MTDESLTGFIEQISGDSHLRVQDDLGDGFVRLRAAEAQRRQAKQDIRSFEDVVIEMLRNARDAACHSIFVATWKEGSVRHLTMIDDGKGIPATHHDMVFEPFVTSKLDSFHADRWGVHGRGMALYSIRENTDEACVVDSAPGLGSVFSVSADGSRLGEKRDQSTLPKLVPSDEGGLMLRGPHNIARTVLEFSIDERSSVAVYLGSATEIAATLFHLGSKAVSRSKAVFCDDLGHVPFYLRLGYALDPVSLSEEANRLGLPMSERSARRIMDGEIAPLVPHLQMLAPQVAKKLPSHKVSKQKHVRLMEEDAAEFAQAIKDAFGKLAERYYLDPDVEPVVRLSHDSLKVTIPISTELNDYE